MTRDARTAEQSVANHLHPPVVFRAAPCHSAHGGMHRMTQAEAQDEVPFFRRATREPLLLRRAVLVYALVVPIIGWGLEIARLRDDRERTLEAARDELTTLAASLQNQFSAMLHDGVGAALAAANEVRANRDGSLGAAATLKRMLTGGAYVRELFIADPNYFASAARPDATHPGALTRDWSETLAAEEATVRAGPPVRAGESLLLPIARRVEGSARWAGALFDLHALRQMYVGLPLMQSSVSIVGNDGTVFMRAPAERDQTLAGRRVVGTEIYSQTEQLGEGLQLYEAPDPFTSEPRLFAALRVEGYPIVAVAGRNVADALAPWRVRTNEALERGAFITFAWLALTAALYIVLSRHHRALHESAQQVREAQQSLLEAQSRELNTREEFAQHLLTAQEQERQRLAAELHDSVGQNLSLIRNRALLALQDPSVTPQAAEHLHALAGLSADVIAEVRTVTHNLKPLAIEQFGLNDALETLLGKAGSASSLAIEHRLEDVSDALDVNAATHAYRIVQEALNNILRHANANRCRVALERDVRTVRLSVEDDGAGFDPQASVTHHGLGLASITERVRMMKGRLCIDAAPGRGVRISVEIPCTQNAAAGSSPPTSMSASQAAV